MPEIINNYLSPTNFTVSIQRLPHVEFFTQKLTIPDVTSSPTTSPTPLKAFYTPATELSYSDLTMEMIVDENMNNYKEILSWMEGYGSPESTDQYKKIAESKDGLVSDIIVLVTNSHKNPNLRFTFTNYFPTSLGSISLDVNVQDVSYATSAITFRYDNFTMEQL